MRLKWFCNHSYQPIGVNRGENLLGSVIWAVEYQCRCLKIKRDAGYGSEASARRALEEAKTLFKH